MSTKWSYSGDPSSSQRDAARFKVGDTVPGDPIFTDAEVDFAVSSEGSTNEAAIVLARAALAKYARMVQVTDREGDKVQSKAYQQKVDHFEKLVNHLIMNRSKRVTGIYAGGISKMDKIRQDDDQDRVAPKFRRNLHDNPMGQITDLDDDEDDII